VDGERVFNNFASSILKEADRITLVSSGTDLILTNKRAIKAEAEVEYVGFSKKLFPRPVAIALRTTAINDE